MLKLLVSFCQRPGLKVISLMQPQPLDCMTRLEAEPLCHPLPSRDHKFSPDRRYWAAREKLLRKARYPASYHCQRYGVAYDPVGFQVGALWQTIFVFDRIIANAWSCFNMFSPTKISLFMQLNFRNHSTRPYQCTCKVIIIQIQQALYLH